MRDQLIMKAKWTHTLLTLLFVLLLKPAHAQREAPRFTSKMDSITAEVKRKLSSQRIDTLMEAYYAFDNGRGDRTTNLFFWTKNGKSYMKVIGHGKKERDFIYEEKECPEFEEIINYYLNNIRSIVGSEPEPSLILSHNYGFYIFLKINGTEFKTGLRNESWMDNDHPRAKWIQLIANASKPFIDFE